MATKAPDMMTVTEAGEALGYGKDTVRKWCQQGFIAATKVGDGRIKHWRIKRSEIDEILRSGGTVKAPDLIKQQTEAENRDPGLEGVGGDEFEMMLGEMGEASENVTVNLDRLSPSESPYGGFLRSYTHAIRLSDIQKEWGGGTYRITISNGNKSKSFTRTVAGDPLGPDEVNEDPLSFRGLRKRRSGSNDREPYGGGGGYGGRDRSELSEVISALRNMESKTTDQMSQLMAVQQQRADDDRRRADEDRRNERTDREAVHKREIELLDKKQDAERHREESRSERELQRDRDRMEADKRQSQDMMKFMASLDQKRDEVTREAQQKTEKYFGQTMGHHRELLETQSKMIDREADLNREHLADLKEAVADNKDLMSDSMTQTIIREVGGTVKKVVDKIGNPPPQTPQPSQPGQPSLTGEQVPQLPVPPNSPLPQNQEKSTMSLEDRMRDDNVADFLVMMADHTEQKVSPSIMADLLLRMGEQDINTQFLITYFLGKPVSQLVGIFREGQLAPRVVATLLSDEGTKWFDTLKALMLESYSEPPTSESVEEQPPHEGNDS